MATNQELEQQMTVLSQQVVDITNEFNLFKSRFKNTNQLDPSLEITGTEEIIVYQGSGTFKTLLNDLLPVRFIKINGIRFMHYKTGGTSTGLEVNDTIVGVFNGDRISAIYLGGAQNNLSDDNIWDKSVI